MSHKLQKESTDIDHPGRKEGNSPFRPKENGITSIQYLLMILVKAFLMLLKIGLIQGINGFGRPGKESLCQDSLWTDTYIFPAVFARLGREDVLQVGSHWNSTSKGISLMWILMLFFLHLVGRSLLKHSREIIKKSPEIIMKLQNIPYLIHLWVVVRLETDFAAA